MSTESIGEQLRVARHAKKASLEDAARATKIKIETLEKLESDEFTRIAAPMYVKGFLRIYANYLGLDGNAVAEAYLRSQGGLRRQGLRLETEATLRERQASELQLPIGAVIVAVAVVSLLVVAVFGVRHFWKARQQQPAVVKTGLPRADFDPYYQPKKPIAAETLDTAGK